MVFDEIVEERFWIEWEDRFESESNKFITPRHPEVEEAAAVASPTMEASDGEKAVACQEYVFENIEYSLSKKWKTPAETLSSGVGDCEDVTFLIASMLPNMGVNESEIAIGDLVFPNGDVETHTWNIVEGVVADGTGSKETTEVVSYKPETTYRIISQ